MSDAAISILIAVVTGAVSAWITVQLSLKRFRSEKWWERKVAAYERVIEALHHSKAFTDAHFDAAQQGRTVSEEKDQDLRRRLEAAHLEIDKATDVGGFLLSDEAQERLKRYGKEAKEAANTPHWVDFLIDDCAAVTSCLSDLIRIAKKDLQAR